MARKRLTVGAQVGLGAAAGLLLAAFGGAADVALYAAAAGALAGYVLSVLRQPMAPTCRVPRWLGGCGGSSKVADGSGNWRPRRPCWRHPAGPPRRFGAVLLGRARPERKL